MTLQIIKRGVDPKTKLVRCSCANCTTVLEGLVTDFKLNSSQKDGDWYEVECPVCKTIVQVATREARNPPATTDEVLTYARLVLKDAFELVDSKGVEVSTKTPTSSRLLRAHDVFVGIKA